LSALNLKLYIRSCLKMPRRLPLRPAKIVGNLFVLFVLIVISTIYYTYVVEVWGPRIMGKNFECV